MEKKFNTVLIRGIQAKTDFLDKQEKLRKKYGIEDIEDADKIIVEKDNFYKFIIRVCVALIRAASMIILILLAICGVLSITYPAPRKELFEIFALSYDTFRSFW